MPIRNPVPSSVRKAITVARAEGFDRGALYLFGLGALEDLRRAATPRRTNVARLVFAVRCLCRALFLRRWQRWCRELDGLRAVVVPGLVGKALAVPQMGGA